MSPAMMVLLAVIITLVVAVPISCLIAVNVHQRSTEAKLGSAEEKARQILDDALRTAETKKREALLEAKEESLRMKNESEKEARDRRAEVQRYEKRVLSKEESIDRNRSKGRRAEETTSGSRQAFGAKITGT